MGPGPCRPPTIRGRRALVSCSEANKMLVSLLNQGQTSAYAQEEGLTVSSLWLDCARRDQRSLGNRRTCPWCREAKTLMSSHRPDRWNPLDMKIEWSQQAFPGGQVHVRSWSLPPLPDVRGQMGLIFLFCKGANISRHSCPWSSLCPTMPVAIWVPAPPLGCLG